MKFNVPKWFKRNNSKVIEVERVIRIGDPEFNRSFTYANNIISTSKYTIFTFLPKNLFEQFQRIANAYFLGLLILQLIPQISSLTPITTVIPLVCVLSLTALKDGIDDIRRHHNDNIVNNRESFVLRNGEISIEKWCKVEVGDILKLTNDQFVAADLLLISSSEPNGLCYIETAELDGETNLKCRQALPDTACLEDDLREMESFNAEIVCEPPNNRLNKFEGTINWNDKILPLDNDKVLLRGCVLRNTKWCYGAVLFAGNDTKLMQNSGKDIFKRTSIDRLVNVLIIGIFIFLVSICLFTAIAHGIWQGRIGIYFRVILPWASFIPPERIFSGTVAISSLTFLSYIILLNTLVPISLYVSVEMIRIAHSFWINWDIKMYDPKTETPAKARTTTLNEELGQIQYIFSDKTGTLTQNIMIFKKCSILGQLYGYIQDEQGNLLSPSEKDKSIDLSANPYYEPKFKFCDERLLAKINGNDPHVLKFFTLLALCHTVMPGEKKGILEYLAQSPDEAALVSAARNFGVVFLSRTPNSITISVQGKEISYEVLAIFDFNNVRKRMSVVIRKDGKITLFCKGADSVVMERLDPSDKSDLVVTTIDHLTKFAVEGLRTLCLAYKEINTSVYKQWEIRFRKTNASLKDREAKLDELYEELEKDMHLLGATAIEDKLQDGVPQTIANLLRAGIRIWVLTGDKQETAINIGYSCQLLNDDVEEIYIIDGQEFSEVQRELECVRKVAFTTPSPQLNGSPLLTTATRSEIGSPLSASSSDDLTRAKSSWLKRLCCPKSVSNVYQKQIPLDAQWEEWNDRIRRNFYWLIAPPSYNYNYHPTNNININNGSSSHNNNNKRATAQPQKQDSPPQATALNSEPKASAGGISATRENHYNNTPQTDNNAPLNLNNNNSNLQKTSNGGKPFPLSPNDNNYNNGANATNFTNKQQSRFTSTNTTRPFPPPPNPAGTGLKQPEIENMTIDVRVTPPQSNSNSLNYYYYNKSSTTCNNNRNSPNPINNNNNNVEFNNNNNNNAAILDNNNNNIQQSTTSYTNNNATNNNFLPEYCVTDNPKIGSSNGGDASLAGAGALCAGRKSPVSPYESRLRYPNKQNKQQQLTNQLPVTNATALPRGVGNSVSVSPSLTHSESPPSLSSTKKGDIHSNFIEVFSFDRGENGNLVMKEKIEARYEPSSSPLSQRKNEDVNPSDVKLPCTAVKVIPVEQILSVSDIQKTAATTDTIAHEPTETAGAAENLEDEENSLHLEEDIIDFQQPPSANNRAPGGSSVLNGAAISPGLSHNNYYEKPSIFALVISGHSLVHALDPRLEQEFVELGSAAMSVICCRVTPLQKAMVVDVVKRFKKATTLAIGDGANDVSMIRRAHIGIGISGLEGRQAVLASDFAIAQFRFLERLILVHGRWSYYRMAKFLRYFFYKNFAFTLCSFWYGFFCGFSAQSLFDPWFISFYNLFYTSLPVLALAFFEQDVDDEMCLRYPQLYRSSLGNKLFNKKIFAQSILHGIISSFILFIVPYFSFQDGMSSQGKETGLFVFGILVSTCLIFTVSLQAGLDTGYWTGFNHFVIWGSIIFYLAMHFLMYSPIFNRTFVGVMLAATGQPKFWFTVVLTVAILTLPVLALRSFFCDTRPNLADRIRYAQRIYNAKRRRRQKAATAAKQTSNAIPTISKFPFLPFPPPHYYDFMAQKPRISIGQSLKTRKTSLRTGYAFAHQQGFGDLIIKGTSFRPIRGSFSDTLDQPIQSSTQGKVIPKGNSTVQKSSSQQEVVLGEIPVSSSVAMSLKSAPPFSGVGGEKKTLFTFIGPPPPSPLSSGPLEGKNRAQKKSVVTTTAVSPTAAAAASALFKPKRHQKGSANITTPPPPPITTIRTTHPSSAPPHSPKSSNPEKQQQQTPLNIQRFDGTRFQRSEISAASSFFPPASATSQNIISPHSSENKHYQQLAHAPTIPDNSEPGVKVINYKPINSTRNTLKKPVKSKSQLEISKGEVKTSSSPQSQTKNRDTKNSHMVTEL